MNQAMKNAMRTFLSAGLAICLAACSTSPLGRKQLKLLPEGQMTQMGAAAFDQMKGEVPVEQNPKLNEYVRCVAEPIAKAAQNDVKAENWEIVVFRDPSANAFALPGGKIGVHTGMLKVAETDDQLAAVIGHEVGHVIAEHSNERVSEGLAAQGGLATIGVLTANNPNRNVIMGLLGVGTQFGILLPHSRTQETEADIVGLQLMAKAGFDPKQSTELWRNMIKANPSAPPEFLSTHPSSEARIEKLGSRIPEVLPAYESAAKHNCVRPEAEIATL